MKKLLIYKEYDVIEELRELKWLNYRDNWQAHPTSKTTYDKLKDIIHTIEEAIEVTIKDGK